jgi:hypothetical protein
MPSFRRRVLRLVTGTTGGIASLARSLEAVRRRPAGPTPHCQNKIESTPQLLLWWTDLVLIKRFIPPFAVVNAIVAMTGEITVTV